MVDVREGPYSHLNPASIQDALYYLEDEKSPSSSATSPSTSVATSATQPRTDLWLPYKIHSSANGDDDDTIAQSVRIITEKSTIKAKLNYSKERVTEILGSQDHDERYNILPPVDGSAVQLEYLPMKPTKLNKELVRIRKLRLSFMSTRSLMRWSRLAITLTLQMRSRRQSRSCQRVHELLDSLHFARSPPSPNRLVYIIMLVVRNPPFFQGFTIRTQAPGLSDAELSAHGSASPDERYFSSWCCPDDCGLLVLGCYS